MCFRLVSDPSSMLSHKGGVDGDRVDDGDGDACGDKGNYF